jgi:hypothetical protein
MSQEAWQYMDPLPTPPSNCWFYIVTMVTPTTYEITSLDQDHCHVQLQPPPPSHAGTVHAPLHGPPQFSHMRSYIRRLKEKGLSRDPQRSTSAKVRQ